MDSRVQGDAVQHVEWWLREQIGQAVLAMRSAMRWAKANPTKLSYTTELRDSLIHAAELCMQWEATGTLPWPLRVVRDNSRKGLQAGVDMGTWTYAEVRHAW